METNLIEPELNESSILFIQPARGPKNEFWRYLINTVVITIITLVGTTVLMLPFLLFFRTANFMDLSPLLIFIVTLSSFPISLAVLFLGLWLLHGRKPKSLIKPVGQFSWSKLIFAAVVWVGILFLSDVISYLLDPTNYQFTLAWKEFMPFLLIGLVFIPIQTSTEELIFRGYFTQWLGRYTNILWVLVLVPNLFFALMHAANPEVQAYGYWLTMPGYYLIGLLFSFLTLKTHGLEMALGIHAINNLYALMITFPNSALAVPAVITIQKVDPVASLIGSFVKVALTVGILYWLKPQWMRGRE